MDYVVYEIIKGMIIYNFQILYIYMYMYITLGNLKNINLKNIHLKRNTVCVKN